MFVFDPLIGSLLPITPIVYDPCAGADADEPTPEGCPTGYAALFGLPLRTPPPPFMYFARGHFTVDPDGVLRTCPATTPPPGDGEVAMTLFTRTPLSEVTARIRPYGTDEAWVDIDIPASSPDDIAWWDERFATLDYDPFAWATLSICLNVPRDPSLAYTITASGTDTFGQPVESQPGLIGLDDPTQRPPTTGEVTGLSSVATVTARSVPDGMVEFRARVVTGPDDALDCATARERDEPVLTGTSAVIPIGVYDPDYNRVHNVRLPIPPGGQLLVCADIFPTTNPLRPTATDRLLFSAPTQERPRIVLQGVRRVGDAPLADFSVRAGLPSSGSTFDRCVSGIGYYDRREPIAPERSLSIEQTLWECDDEAIPVDAAGAVEVIATVTRVIGGERYNSEVALPVQLRSCLDPAGCERPREWYEVPIPSGNRTLCGTGFGGGCEDADIDGIAVIRIEYPVVAGADSDPDNPARGVVTLLDQVDAPRATGAPVVYPVDVRILPGPSDDFLRDVEIDIIADRPVHIVASARQELTSGCPTPTPVEPEGFASEFTIELTGMCAGTTFSIQIHATDEDGNEYDFDRGYWYTVPSISATIAAQLQFLGGPDVPAFGYVYQLDITIDGQRPTAYWFDSTGLHSGRSCYPLGPATTFRSRGFWEPTYVSPPDLDVRVRVNITTTGATTCGSSGRTGLGEIVLEGSFTPEQYLTERVLVLETEAGATLPMRLTLTREGPWLNNRTGR
jgi:hypothetical protein